MIDSRTVSSGLGTLVLEAAKVAAEGADVDAVVRRVSDLIPRTHVFAALNTLENLKKGGRIGGATAMVGSLLSIKPVIDLSGGVVHEAGKARTRKRALQMLYERLASAGPIEHVAVMHCEAPDINQFLDLIAPRFPREAVRIGTLGAVVGVHGGASDDRRQLDCLCIGNRSKVLDSDNHPNFYRSTMLSYDDAIAGPRLRGPADVADRAAPSPAVERAAGRGRRPDAGTAPAAARHPRAQRPARPHGRGGGGLSAPASSQRGGPGGPGRSGGAGETGARTGRTTGSCTCS